MFRRRLDLKWFVDRTGGRSLNLPVWRCVRFAAGPFFDWKDYAQYPRMFVPTHHTSIMAATMTPAYFNKVRWSEKTESGWTIARAVQCGVEVPHLKHGILAGDAESYVVFREYWELHCAHSDAHGFSKRDPNHKTDLSRIDMDHITPSEKELLSQGVVRVEVEARRNVSGFPMPCAMQVCCGLVGCVCHFTTDRGVGAPASHRDWRREDGRHCVVQPIIQSI